MMLALDNSVMTRYRGYILYGKNIENLLKRVIAFVDGCKNIVADTILSEMLSKLCTEKPEFIEFKSYTDIDKVIASAIEGKAIVFAIKPPREDIHAIALIPIDRFNKSRVIGGS